MKRLTKLLMALVMALSCIAAPLGALAEPAISNEVVISPPEQQAEAADVPTEPELSLSMSLTPEYIAPGGDTSVLLTLTNAGAPVSGRSVYLYLPTGFAPVNPEVLVYDPATGVVTWTPAQVGTNEAVSLAVDVQVPQGLVAGSSYGFSANSGDLNAYATATVLDTTFSLSMRSTVKYAEPGDAVLYTITVQNRGNADAQGLILTNIVPLDMTVDPASLAENGGVYVGGVITWYLNLAAGEARDIKFLGVIPYSAEEGDVYTNVAQLGDLTSATTVTVYEPEPELSITKKVNNRTPAPGTTVRYTITVKNTGGADAYDVEVVDELPIDLEVERKSITHGGTYSARQDEITWWVDVPAYDSVTLTFRGYVPDYMEDGDRMVNTARIPGEDYDRATMYVTEDAVPKTGEASVVPAAWDAVAPAKPALATSQTAPVSGEAGEAEVVPLPSIVPAFEETYAKNDDLIGWLKVADQVDEPIVQAENNDFYMIRNFDQKDDEAGALFLDERNHVFPADQHLLIYGHNMKSGAMFGKLADYRDLGYLKANPTFTFQSVYDAEPTTYVVVAALDASMDVGNKDYLKIRRPNFDDEADAIAYIQSIKDFSYFDIPVEWDETDSMMSLVTCSYLQDNGRFLIIGRPLREGETAESVAEVMAGATKRA